MALTRGRSPQDGVFATTTDLINYSGTWDALQTIETTGRISVGDGLGGIWKLTGNIIAASQSPFQTGDYTLSDANGNEFRMVKKVTVFETLSSLIASSADIGFIVSLISSGSYTIDILDKGENNLLASGFYANSINEFNGGIPSKVDYYQEGLSDTKLTVVSPEDGDYLAFPVSSQQKSGRILVAYMHQTQHTGSSAADVVCKYSDDAGATWSSEVVIYGTLNGTDAINPYFVTLGVDNNDDFVALFNTYASNPGTSPSRPNITRSVDGAKWDSPSVVTFSGDAEVVSATIIPFGSIKALPSGKLAMAFYQLDNNWVGVMDYSASLVDFELRLVINSASPLYSEMAFLPYNESVWFAFLRLDGSTNSIPYLTSDDAGDTWTARGSMGDNGGVQVGGGWVVQNAERVVLNGVPSVMVTAGARVSGSGLIDNAPAVKVFTCSATEARSNTGLWRLTHEYSLVNDGFDRDVYCSVISDDSTGNALLLTHEETASDESRILSGGFNYNKSAQEPELENISLNSVSVTYTDQVGRFTKIDKIVFFRIEINYTGLDTTDASGIAIVTSSFPFSVVNSNHCSIDTENSTGFTFTSGDDIDTNFASSNAVIQVHKSDGAAWGYNSGKIAAAGKVIFYGQYETS